MRNSKQVCRVAGKSVETRCGRSVGRRVVGAVMAVLLAFTAPGMAASDARSSYQLKIERQPLATALQEFAKQSGIQIVFFSKLTRGYDAPALEGTYMSATALDRLLEGTGLTFVEIGEGIIEVQARGAEKVVRDGGSDGMGGRKSSESGGDGVLVAQEAGAGASGTTSPGGAR